MQPHSGELNTHTQEKPQLVTDNDASFPTVRKRGGAAAAADEKKKQRNEKRKNKKKSSGNEWWSVAGTVGGNLMEAMMTKKTRIASLALWSSHTALDGGNLISNNNHRDSFRFLLWSFLLFFGCVAPANQIKYIYLLLSRLIVYRQASSSSSIFALTIDADGRRENWGFEDGHAGVSMRYGNILRRPLRSENWERNQER